MTREVRDPVSTMSRRTLVQGLAVAAGATVAGAGSSFAQNGPVAPPSTVTTPPRDFSPHPKSQISDSIWSCWQSYLNLDGPKMS